MSVPWDLSDAEIEDLKRDLLSKIINSEWAEQTYKYVFSWFKCIRYKSLFLDNCDKSKDKNGYKEMKYFSADFILGFDVNLAEIYSSIWFRLSNRIFKLSSNSSWILDVNFNSWKSHESMNLTIPSADAL